VWANATSDGITRDLEAMAESGIGGTYLMPIGNAGKRTLALSAEGWVQFEFAEPFTCRSIRMSPDQRTAYQLHRVEVLIGDDGLPVEVRTTWTWHHNERWLDPKEPLDPAGFMGIVTLKTARPAGSVGLQLPSLHPNHEQPE